MPIAAAWAYKHPRPAEDQIVKVRHGTDSVPQLSPKLSCLACWRHFLTQVHELRL